MADSQGFQVQRAAPGDVERLSQMLDTVYRPQLRPGDGMRNEFPHLFCAENAGNLYYIADNGKPVSMIAVLPQQVVLQGITIDVVSIGSVVTLPEYRGRKLSSSILDEIVADWSAAGIPLMLVSGDRGLYRRIHCVPVGTMLEVTHTGMGDRIVQKAGSPSPADDAAERGVVEVQAEDRAEWAQRLAPLYRAEAYRYRRTDEQMATLMNALWFARDGYSQRLFVIFEGGEVAAYVVAYQALASPAMVDVMEWAGSRVAVIEALEEIESYFGANRVRLHVHQSDWTMQSLVKTHGLDCQSIPLQGTLRLLDVRALFDALAPILVERFGSEAKVQQQGDSWSVRVGNHQFGAESLEELTYFVFNSGGEKLGIDFVHTDDLNYI